jgi:hypothetical protein
LPSCLIGKIINNIDYGAHHLDLRPPNAADPRSVIECRALVLSTLKKWIGIQ